MKPLPSETLIEYPSNFPIKVMGSNVNGFMEAVSHVARSFDPGFDPKTVTTRLSTAGKYIGMTITITATSREQLDGLYAALTAHPMVKVVL